ncbi:hypothetical protein HF923_07560 [Acidithiobacillus ferriphilus]|uniref:hypothetical protein n=1 Tax=Acidithiobacillus ferriphilus TaxID=1689834 RepID=UPI001C073373|nr:hypothetical protein [Acidithiobacillus ferriphilus]MBU2845678.1 hypothetical protein [Acidithiobacillus ferriphilus]MEB8476234.1 hypothetical protein [Acidithiobacillus ferriphilus]
MDIKEMGERTNPERGASTVALEHYREILAARQHLWRWVDIADALGYPNVNALNKAFLRIDKLVAKGKLKPTGGQRKPDAAGKSGILGDRSQQRKSTGASTGASTVIDLDDPANQ